MSPTHPKIAAIDVGSNTLRLLIVEITGPDHYQILHQEQEITRLGEGLGKNVGAQRAVPLQDAAMERSLAVLKKFGETACAFGVQEILAVGTRALRETKNGKAFAEAAEREAGYPLRIIDEEQEARLALLGVFGALPQLENILLVDIGGGSTELTIARRQADPAKGGATRRPEKTLVGAQFMVPEILWSNSTDLGVVRLLELFLHHDPPLMEEKIKLSAYIKEKIENQIPNPYSLTPDPCTLVGTAGTYTTLAALDQQMEIYDPAKINGYTLTVERLQSLEDHLYSLPLEQRKTLQGLEPGRADVILPGATLARVVNQVFGYEKVMISDGGLREGMVWEWIKGRD